jgi:S1-C subfamily serine protease
VAEDVASQGSQSFAIPINEAVRIATEIQSGRPSTGVHVGPTAYFGVDILPGVAASGAMATAVFAGTPAAAAGLRAGDIIVSVGGATVESAEALSALVGPYRPGAAVLIGWVDPTGTAQSAIARLAAGPPL